jgi:nicotinamide-nucleotide amidase
VTWRTTVGDNVDFITEAIARAIQRSEIVIATGGLGPTNDDVTKKAICKYFRRPLVLYENILKVVENRFKSRGLIMPAINQNQALLPQGAEFIDNAVGSAVGIVLEEEGRLFISVPGVPEEMRPMVSGWVVDAIKKRAGGMVTIHRKIKTVGIFESALYEKVFDLVEGKNIGPGEDKISVAFLPSWRGVEMRLTISTKNESEGQRQIAELDKKIAGRIGEYIYGYGDISLPEAVGKLLNEKNKTLAIAESCTGGLLGNVITEIPGSSKYFIGGIIAYSNGLKSKYLSVPEETLTKHGAVSAETAEVMAIGARANLGSDIAVSITGIAGPDGGTAEKPVGLVYIGLSAADKNVVIENQFGNDRNRTRERSISVALDMIRKYLIGKLE